jgi:hypothetical protein
MEAIRRVMAEHPEREWSAGSILAILQERRWLSPNAREPRRNVESSLSRLNAREEVDRVREGRYVWRGEVESSERD